MGRQEATRSGHRAIDGSSGRMWCFHLVQVEPLWRWAKQKCCAGSRQGAPAQNSASSVQSCPGRARGPKPQRKEKTDPERGRRLSAWPEKATGLRKRKGEGRVRLCSGGAARIPGIYSSIC